MLKKRQVLYMLGVACLVLVLVAGGSYVGFSSHEGRGLMPVFLLHEAENETSSESGSTSDLTDANKGNDIISSAETASGVQDNENLNTIVVTLPTETTTAEPETTVPEPEPSVFDGLLLPNVRVYLNIRAEATTDSKVLGKLYVGDLATILEAGEEWSYITSGSVTGYVSNEYTVTGKAAEAYVIDEDLYTAKATVSGLRIRKEPSLDCEFYGSAYKGQTFAAISVENGWVKIKHSTVDSPDGIAYLAAEYVELSYDFGEAISIEEEQEQLRLAREAKEKAAREEEERIRKILEACVVVNVANREPVPLSDEDIYLLACLVYEEAGGEPYEGKLAVANVVINRLLAGYGDTLTEVIYAKNQFSTAKSGVLDKRLEKGPSSSCVQAAMEAAAGVNNIGDYCHFITTEKADYSVYTQYTIINKHCFYKRTWGKKS